MFRLISYLWETGLYHEISKLGMWNPGTLRAMNQSPLYVFHRLYHNAICITDTIALQTFDSPLFIFTARILNEKIMLLVPNILSWQTMGIDTIVSLVCAKTIKREQLYFIVLYYLPFWQ